jgi:hypothetical protein
MRRRIVQKPITNDYFSLSANGGLPRYRLLEYLQRPKLVKQAAATGRCMMCRATDIDQTALCLVCRSFLSDEERKAAQIYYDEP